MRAYSKCHFLRLRYVLSVRKVQVELYLNGDKLAVVECKLEFRTAKQLLSYVEKEGRKNASICILQIAPPPLGKVFLKNVFIRLRITFFR